MATRKLDTTIKRELLAYISWDVAKNVFFSYRIKHTYFKVKNWTSVCILQQVYSLEFFK